MDREGREFSGSDAEPKRETAEMLFPRKRRCFCMPCFGSDRSPALGVQNWWNRMRPLENDDGWFGRGINALRKFREWSEILAGPRWKTFIRRFNRNKNGGGTGGGGGKHGLFQYDALSYSLNFDEGPGQSDDFDEEIGFRNFSSRFAVIPMSAKSSMDLGRDAPSFA